jgi:hypothetical protein
LVAISCRVRQSVQVIEYFFITVRSSTLALTLTVPPPVKGFLTLLSAVHVFFNKTKQCLEQGLAGVIVFIHECFTKGAMCSRHRNGYCPVVRVDEADSVLLGII